jgi:F-type H+-transporting ATPase subunit gamma
VTERLADIGARIAGIRQLGAVVNAMRGIAAARVQQARGQLEAVDLYAAEIALAIGRALALLPFPEADRGGGRKAIVLFCAEQGFAGAFSERVLDRVGSELATAELLLIGTRGAAVAAERGVSAAWWRPMPSHSPGIPGLADQIAEALYAAIASGRIEQLDAVFSARLPGHGVEVTRQLLFPLDLTLFAAPAGAREPLLNLAPEQLLRELGADYLHAQLCHAALHAFAAENEARMEAMAAASSQIGRQLATLEATQRRVRQEEITAEIVELAAGETANRAVPG